MKSRVRLGLTFTLALAVFQASAFAQAAAESVLLNAGSAAATAKTGKSFQSATDRITKQLANRVQRQTSPPARKATPVAAQPASASAAQGTEVREGATSASGPMIASIQGAQATCTPTDQKASTPESPAAATSAQTKCSGQDPARRPASRERPSVITLSFSK